jgi:threonine synthase
MEKIGILEKYGRLISLPRHTASLTLGEGDTPLIPIPALSKTIGANCKLFVKFEGLNPTGSFKDRGMVAAIAEMKGRGIKKVICASTGNTAASAAAYARRAGIEAVVLIPKGKIARGKLAGAFAYGAKVIQVEGNFDDCLRLAKACADDKTIGLVNSVNPYRLEGQKTAAFEICDSLGKAPDLLCLPVGNAGNISAYALGFEEYKKKKKTKIPQFLGVQAEGAAPLVYGKIVEKPETVATAIRIGNPARGEQALGIIKKYGKAIIAVSDEKILAAQKMLAEEGIWVEPASAAGLAGLIIQIKKKAINVKGKTVVIVCTGNGMKDPDIIPSGKIIAIKPTNEALLKIL